MNNEQIAHKSEQEYIESGRNYLKQGKWDDAIREFKKVLEINPLNIWAYIELGKLYRNKLNFDSAEKIFKEILGMSLNNEQLEQVYMALGEAYLLEGKYKQAKENFENTLKIGPGNKRLKEWLEDKNKTHSFRKEIAPYRVFFTWGIHYQCNFRCSYCNAPKPENASFNEKEQNRATYLGIKEWICAWNNIYKKYGSCRIRLDGGEPSIYPYFTELVAEISKQHLIQINTNLSFNVLNFAKKVSLDRVRIDASFHPEFLDFEDFLHKILVFKEHGFKIVVSCVAYPPFLDKINDYKKPFATLDIPFIIHPFSGDFNGKNYPKAYELEEVSKIYNLDEASKLIMGWRKGEKNITKGKICRMGQIYGRIYPNGDVYRCCADGGTLKIGNIFDESFQLLDEPLECSSENCPCWKCMIIGEEERWSSRWLDDWELPPMNNDNGSDAKQNHLRLGYNFSNKGDYNLAIKEFEELLKIEPQNEIAILELGKTYKMMNKCKEAIEKFIQLLRIYPDNKEAIIELGETSRMSNNSQVAIEELQKIIRKSPLNDQAYIELSKIFQKNSDYDSAFKELYKALAINKNNSEIYMCFGQLYRAKKEKEKTVLSLREAIKYDANNKNAHLELGDIYQEEKNYAAALREIEAAKKISPFHIEIRLKLIELYGLQNQHDLSAEETKEILDLRPNDPFSQDSMLNEIEILQRKTILKSKVKRLWVTLTSRCNIKCRTCGLWSSPWDIPRKTVDEVLQYYPYLERLVWLGGEVFLSPYFEEMFEKALAFPHLQQQVITNGVILTEKWIEKIIKAPNTELTVSVDGTTKDVYEYIRRGASFEKLISNIKLANEIKQGYSSKTPMRLNAVIMKSNYHQLEDFIEFAKEFGFCQVSLMAIHLDNDPEENILYSKKNPNILEYITQVIPKIRQKAKSYSIDLDILLPTEDLKFEKFENKNNNTKSYKQILHCKMPWKYMFICDKGTTYLTGSCAKPIGNIYENSLDEIWNNREAQLYREAILKNQFQERCLPECMTRWEM